MAMSLAHFKQFSNIHKDAFKKQDFGNALWIFWREANLDIWYDDQLLYIYIYNGPKERWRGSEGLNDGSYD